MAGKRHVISGKHCILQRSGPLNSANTCLMKLGSAAQISLTPPDVPLSVFQRLFFVAVGFFPKAAADFN